MWAILAEEKKYKVYVNQDESLTDLQIYSLNINFFEFPTWISNEFLKVF